MAKVPEKKITRSAAALLAVHTAREAKEPRRGYLGASGVGHECARKVWYDFRQVTDSEIEPRVLRLFETGHLQEARVVKEAKEAGWEVLDVDEDGEQFEFVGHRGHFAGHCDGFVRGIPEAPKTWHLLEVKTASAKRFAEMKKNGIGEVSLEYDAQVQIYMDAFGVRDALWILVNKDTDEIHTERTKLDPKKVARITSRAKQIIDSDEPPPRISEDPSYWKCGWCAHRFACHATGEGGLMTIARGCRSCASVNVGDDGLWFCGSGLNPDVEPGDGEALSPERQKKGCSEHLLNPHLAPSSWRILDAGEDATDRWIRYAKPDGSIFLDSPEARARREEGGERG